MTKQEMFDKIISTCAEVCKVTEDDIKNGCRREDVVTARTITIFWCDAAGFSVESLLRLTNSNNANSINSIKARVEPLWKDCFAFHVYVKEVGERLYAYAKSIGEEFDMYAPLKRLRKATGKY